MYDNVPCPFDTIAKLANLGDHFPACEKEIKAVIRVLVGPEPEKTNGYITNCSPLDPSTDELVLARTNKIQAIKAYRERTLAGLKDAKERIENACVKLGIYKLHENGNIC